MRIHNLIAFSVNKNPDWDSCGNFIEVNESLLISVMHIEQNAAPYGKPLPLIKFWTLDSLNEDEYEFINSDAFAINKAIIIGLNGILYCHKNERVMSGYH